MADHVARTSVQLADEASSNANQVAQSLDLVTTSADKATAATVDVSAATKDFKISAIRLATPPQRWAMSRPRWRIIPARSLITLSIRHTRQYHQILPRRLGRSARGVHCRQCDLRRNHRKRSATHRNPRQRHPIREKAEPAFADNLDVQSTATDSATTSSDKLNDSTGNLAEREIALYTAISGGKAAVTAMIENMVKSTATSTDAAGSTGVLAGAFSALLSPIGLATTRPPPPWCASAWSPMKSSPAPPTLPHRNAPSR